MPCNAWPPQAANPPKFGLISLYGRIFGLEVADRCTGIGVQLA
jgi:hypothetical protein